MLEERGARRAESGPKSTVPVAPPARVLSGTTSSPVAGSVGATFATARPPPPRNSNQVTGSYKTGRPARIKEVPGRAPSEHSGSYESPRRVC